MANFVWSADYEDSQGGRTYPASQIPSSGRFNRISFTGASCG